MFLLWGRSQCSQCHLVRRFQIIQNPSSPNHPITPLGCCLSISFELGKQHHSPYLNFENLTYKNKNIPSWVQNSIFKQIKTTYTNDSHHITAIVTVGKGSCHLRFSGIRPLRGGGYPPFPLRKKTFFFSHWFSVKGGVGVPPNSAKEKNLLFRSKNSIFCLFYAFLALFGPLYGLFGPFLTLFNEKNIIFSPFRKKFPGKA